MTAATPLHPDIPALVEALGDALDLLLRRTCPSMVPLWLKATQRARKHLGKHSIQTLPFEPSPRYLGLSKGSRSKYRALAAWRHALLWLDAMQDIPDEDYRLAVDAIYLTPYPADKPPFSYARSAADAPALGDFDNPTTLKEYAKEGCWHTLVALDRRRAKHASSPRRIDIIMEALLGPATAGSLTDQLKLEEHPTWRHQR